MICRKAIHIFVIFLPEWCLPEINKLFDLKKTCTEKKKSSKYPQLTEMSVRQRKPSKEQTPAKQSTSAFGTFLANTLKSAIGSPKPERQSSLVEKSDTKNSVSTDSESASYVNQINIASLPSSRHQLGIFRGILSPVTSDVDDCERLKEEATSRGEELMPIADQNIDPIDLCHIILNIITTICQDSSSNASSNSQDIALNLLPQLGQLLVLMQDELESGNEIAQGWTLLDYINIQRLLFRLILTAMFHLSKQGNGIVLLQRTGIMQALVSWGHLHRENIEEGDSSSDIFQAKNELCYELNEGIFGVMEASLKHIAINPSSINSLLSMLKDFSIEFGFDSCNALISNGMFKSVSDTEDDDSRKSCVSIDPSVRLIHVISTLVNEMKKVKISYIHTVKCSKKNHRNCDYSRWKHHHHDILSTLFSSSPGATALSTSNTEGTDGPSCMIAFMLDILLTNLSRCQSKTLKLKILSSLERCGLCCCVAPEVILKGMICNIGDQSPSVRNYVLTLMCRFLLEQSGGLRLDQYMNQQENKVHCKVCEVSSRDKDSSKSHILETSWTQESNQNSNLYSMSDSAFSSGENTFHFESSVSKWACVKEFKILVFDKDPLLGLQVMQHLLKLVHQGNTALQTQLYHAVFYPVLVSVPVGRTKSEQSLTSIGLSDKIINCCLSGLPLLLQTKAVMSHFVNMGGIKKLCHLLVDSNHRTATCKVFQMMILVEAMPSDSVPTENFAEISSKESTEEPAQDYPDVKEKNIVTRTFLELLQSIGVNAADVEQHVQDNEPDSLFTSLDIQPFYYSKKMKKGPEIMSDLWMCASLLFYHSSHFRYDLSSLGLCFHTLVKVEKKLAAMEYISTQNILCTCFKFGCSAESLFQV